MNLNNRLAIKIYFPAVKITGAAVSSVPDTIPESCDSSFTEADQLAFPMLSNEDETFFPPNQAVAMRILLDCSNFFRFLSHVTPIAIAK